MKPLAAVALAALLGGCIPENGPMMEPGDDCLECHGGTGGEESAVAWTLAGTFGGEGQAVTITEVAPGTRSFTITANQAGNFYTREPLRYPVRVSVGGELMPDPVPAPSTAAGTCLDVGHCCSGSVCGCNDCHGGGEHD
ncbi:MAG TPA: hypothetical protein VFL83_13515 [Anaeromyxobacter sp.]|nr:hypothetical protein [Anaeromyxobacter sp.]